MSSSSSSADKRDKCENEFSEFLLKRLRNAGGELPLQHVTGHLSQLSYDVRLTIGTSKTDLVHFLKRHSDLFSIHGGVVKIVDSLSSTNGDYDSDCSSIEPQLSLPLNIIKGKGVIIKIFPEFGFIKSKEPVKTVVYFQAISYGNKDIDLTGSLFVGAMVYFNARKKNNDSRSKYFATKVWKVDESDMNSSIIVQKSRRNRDTGLYDPMTLDSEGVIQNVFPNLGFIAVKGDENNTVFFHKNRLLKYDNIVDLTKVLSKGDIVEFTAHRSTKQDAKARWEATKVWKKSSKIKEDCGIPKSDSKDNHSNRSSVSKTDMKNKNSDKEMIKNQRGKICPRSQGAVIKFGQNELADGDGSDYYISGCQVHDISWEFAEGDDVFFDAVKIKSAPGWKAVLVWVGEKPDVVLATCLGDFSAFTDDETDDNLSNYMSYSSNSSVKSVSVKSESSSSKNRQIQKETSRLSSDTREVQKHNMKQKLHDSSSQYGSQSSLSSSTKSKSSQRSKKEHRENSSSNKFLNAENKSVLCWGDSPYPADDSHLNVSASDDSYLYVSASDDSYLNVSASDNNECNSAMTLSHTTVRNEKGQSKSEHSTSSVDEEKIENIEKELPLPSEDIKYKKKAVSEATSKVKETASVKRFRSVEGKIIKVYSKFAEVKHKELEKMVSFFWNNFYFNGVSVEELELDDLKQVLKVGDIIYFNYFEIVDDSGQNWQKVTLAWKDSRPKKVIELSPEDFINQNNLSVSINCKTLDDKEEDNVTSRKYLAAIDDLGPDKAESCSKDESLTPADHSDVHNKTPDCKSISSAVIQILKKDIFPSNSKVDLNFIAEEIITIVLENDDSKKCDDKFCQTLSLNETLTSSITCTDCGKIFMLNSSDDVNTKNSEVQTIITGEIIAQNIFTEC